jgi:DNA-binding response OmpR family regulator
MNDMEQLTNLERPVRVLIIDDEPMISEMLTMGLSHEGFEVSVARSGFDAFAQVRSSKPDVVVLDSMLPGLDSVAVCKRLRAQGDMGILMLTPRSAVEERIAGLENGSDDCLGQPFHFREFLARVRAILRRRGVNTESALQAGEVIMDRHTHRVARAGRFVDLTPREFALLELLLLHPRQVFSREFILNRVWGQDDLWYTNVVDVCIRRLREKLGDEERTLIRSVRGIGYTLEPGDE